MCIAQQSGDRISIASYGACVDLNTSCDVMMHVTCLNSFEGVNAGMLPNVQMETIEKVCGSDQKTYSM